MKTRGIMDFSTRINLNIGSNVTIIDKTLKTELQAKYLGTDNSPANNLECFKFTSGETPIKNSEVTVVFNKTEIADFIVATYRLKNSEIVLIKQENIPTPF